MWLFATRGATFGGVGHRRRRHGGHRRAVYHQLRHCAGDPFYAINNHTDVLSEARRRTDVRPISAVNYSIDKFDRVDHRYRQRGARRFVYPFANKWVGLDELVFGARTAHWAALAITGLVAWLWWPEGACCWVMFFGSLVPFSTGRCAAAGGGGPRAATLFAVFVLPDCRLGLSIGMEICARSDRRS